MNTKRTSQITGIKNIYERMIQVFFFGKPSEELKALVHQDFMGYGTAAHEFLSNFKDLMKLTQTQSAQLKTHPLTITRKTIYEKFLVNNTSYLIVEEFNIHDAQNDYRFTARLSAILENISDQWLVTHFHASTPDANIDTKEAFPLEGLRKKNLELEAKIKERTRDLKVEAALERLRTRTMAMRDSSELSEVVATLLQELTKLDFSLTFCIINIVNLPDNSNTVWAANPEEGKAPESYYMKFEDYPFHHAMMKEWKAQTPKFVYVMEGEEKKIYDDYLYTDTEFKRFPKEVQDANRKLERYVASFVFSKFGGLQTVGDQPLPDESLEILYRFGKVFDQTYTRFLDLQKAEAQAREAQIEAALERVRSRSMAMHKSDELQEVIEIVFDQILKLGLMADSANFIIFNHKNKDVLLWLAAPNQKIHRSWNVPYTDIYPMNMFLKELENGNDFFMASCSFEQKNKWFNWAFEHSDFKYFPDETKEFILKSKFWSPSYAWLKNTGIQLNSFSRESFTENENDILKRFAKVFEQTYTRFLDLKKAEARAREAKIETALEKVRSRSMAMHMSEELEEVILVVSEQLQQLEFRFDNVSFALDADQMGLNFYLSSPTLPKPLLLNLPYLVSARKVPKFSYKNLFLNF